MEYKLNIKIAYWYYTLGLTQDEIAKRLSITRQKVNHIISSLRDQGIVTINIHGYEQENIKYECQIEEKFGLKRVIIASDYGEEETSIYKVANVAAQYLEDCLQPNDIIGASWGRTLAETIKAMRYQSKSTCRVIQLIGAQGTEPFMIKSDEITRELANKLDCPSYMLYAPVILSSALTKKMLMAEPGIQSSFAWFQKCNVGIFGIGELTKESSMCRRGNILEEDIKRLRSEGFCGDIGMNPVRADGSWADCYLTDRLINASMECIRDIQNSIAIACGAKKAEATLAVLRSGCIDTLIIDATMAERIIQMLDIEL